MHDELKNQGPPEPKVEPKPPPEEPKVKPKPPVPKAEPKPPDLVRELRSAYPPFDNVGTKEAGGFNYRGPFSKTGDYHGPGTMKFPNNDVFLGTFKNGRKAGVGMIAHQDGAITYCTYDEEGRPDGIQVYVNQKTNEVKIRTWKNGELTKDSSE